jgi:GNAT superfamily N-acetyltransferase
MSASRAVLAPLVRPARVTDAAAISGIYCATLGAGYTTPSAIAHSVAEASGLQSRSRTCWFVAECATERPTGQSAAEGSTRQPATAARVVGLMMRSVVGAANALWVTREELPALGMPGFEDVPPQLLTLAPKAARFGLLENLGVLPAHRGGGIGTALTQARLRWFATQEVGFAYSFAWHTPAGCPAESTLRRAGFRFVRELPDFYLEDGLANGYACPWCGPACHCSARLFVRELDGPPRDTDQDDRDRSARREEGGR